MHSSEYLRARTSAHHMNIELTHVELELSSVEYKLRGLLHRFSHDEISRHARRDLVRKSLDKLNTLKNFYSALNNPTGGTGSAPPGGRPPRFDEEQIQAAIITVAQYLQDRRDHYFPTGVPLGDRFRPEMERFFSPALLRKIRVVEISEPIAEPPFYAQARSLGIPNLPNLPHMASMTFVDALVFTRTIKARDLFHALVHAVQFDVLGLMRYTDLYVRCFLQMSRNFMVPLETQAFALDTRFATNPAEAFDVEKEVWNWASEGRYAGLPANAKAC
jgi:hypothetical protein